MNDLQTELKNLRSTGRFSPETLRNIEKDHVAVLLISLFDRLAAAVQTQDNRVMTCLDDLKITLQQQNTDSDSKHAENKVALTRVIEAQNHTNGSVLDLQAHVETINNRHKQEDDIRYQNAVEKTITEKLTNDKSIEKTIVQNLKKDVFMIQRPKFKDLVVWGSVLGGIGTFLSVIGGFFYYLMLYLLPHMHWTP